MITGSKMYVILHVCQFLCSIIQILDTTVYKDLDGKRQPGYHIHFQRWNNRCVGGLILIKIQTN